MSAEVNTAQPLRAGVERMTAQAAEPDLGQLYAMEYKTCWKQQMVKAYADHSMPPTLLESTQPWHCVLPDHSMPANEQHLEMVSPRPQDRPTFQIS
jgi:hypothetical protein